MQAILGEAVQPDLFRASYGKVFEGDDTWRALPVPTGKLFSWDDASTYIANPPYFVGMTKTPPPNHEIEGARCLAVLEDQR